jgi:predicted CoA-binding protein
VFDLLRHKHPDTTIAVVGASNNTSKYGNIIVEQLLKHGYTIWPVNPKLRAVRDLPCYPSVGSLPGSPGIVNIVTPPEVTLQVLGECAKAGVQNVWLQPGSFDKACLDFAATAPFQTVSDACIMVIAAQS